MHGAGVGVALQLDYLGLGAGDLLNIDGVLREDYAYLLVVLGHDSGTVVLENAPTCLGDIVAQVVLGGARF